MCGATSQVTARAGRSVLPAKKRSSIAMRRLHFALSVASLAVTLAMSSVATPAVADDDWTVLTMAPDGSWGAATSFSINRAIAFAIANCKIAYQRDIGSGAFFTSIQAGYACHCWGGQ